MSASSYYDGQYQPDRLSAVYPEQQQPYHNPPGEQYQGPPPLPPPPRSSSASPYPVPQDPGYGQPGYSHNYAGYEQRQQPPQGLLYPPGGHEYNNTATTGYGQKTGSAQEYYYDHNIPVTHSPYDEHGQQQQQQQYPAAPPQIAQIQVQEDPSDPAEGERGLGGGLLGGVAGLVAGHQVNHGLLGAVGGGIAGSLLQDQFKKHGKHEQEEYEQDNDYEHEHEHRHRHRHSHHRHHSSHSHSHSHSRHRSVSRNGGSSSGGDFSDDGSRYHRHGY